MKIRKAIEKDKKEFLETQKEAFPNLNLKKQAEYFNLKLKNKECFVISDRDNYMGHLCFGKHLLNPPFAKSVFIEELAVKKQFRGRGCGTFLIKGLVDYCKENKIKVIYLGTGDYSKNRNISYYKKQGFEIVGKLKDINPSSDYNYGQIFMAVLVDKWRKH